MIFTKNGNNLYSVSQPNNLYKQVVKQHSVVSTRQQNINQPQPQPQMVQPKVMAWGEPTWVLLHTLAEKVKDEYFSQIKTELLDLIFSICANLPCPDCANHASAYMTNINYRRISTKDELKNMLYQFHNMVNRKKDFPILSEDVLTKYKNVSLLPVLYAFMIIFQDKHSSFRMIANDLHRGRITVVIKTWFNKNIQYFNL